MRFRDPDLEPIGLKHVLAIRYHAPIVRIAKTITGAPIPADVAEIIGLDAGDRAMLLRVIGYSHDGTAISYPPIWIPPTDMPLDVATGPRPNGLTKGQEQ